MSGSDEEYWFKPKHHGYGATPIHWKGWAATALFGLSIVGISMLWLPLLDDGNRLSGMTVWAAGLLAAIWFFCSFARRKTNGSWGWRWNGRLYKDMLGDIDDKR